jgi:hypothetical protein
VLSIPQFGTAIGRRKFPPCSVSNNKAAEHHAHARTDPAAAKGMVTADISLESQTVEYHLPMMSILMPARSNCDCADLSGEPISSILLPVNLNCCHLSVVAVAGMPGTAVSRVSFGDSRVSASHARHVICTHRGSSPALASTRRSHSILDNIHATLIDMRATKTRLLHLSRSARPSSKRANPLRRWCLTRSR